MTNIRRHFGDSNIVFTSHITCQRRPILLEHGDLLITILSQYEHSLIAWVILPDHFHCIIEGHGNNLSNLFRRIKLSFSAHYRKRIDHSFGRAWQYRFWDHIIRNQDDLNNHIDYIHYNPVKHGYSRSPFEWAFSSIHKYYQQGYYQRDWGTRTPIDIIGDYGE
nr:transposase [candidate division Zixibacteria bacterium]